MVFLEKFVTNKTLNTKLFDSESNLLPEVREKLLEIANYFAEYSDVTIPILDIYIVGSNASYNYTPTSDIDLHIITNYELVEAPEKILEALYNFQKSAFNNEYDITIHGLEVELYVEDVNNSSAVSNGVYSVYNDKWVKFPKRIIAQSYNFDSVLPKWRRTITAVCEKDSLQDATFLLNRIYMMRKESILKDGEFGKGNQLFKDLREEGLIQELKDKLTELTSKKLSI